MGAAHFQRFAMGVNQLILYANYHDLNAQSNPLLLHILGPCQFIGLLSIMSLGFFRFHIFRFFRLSTLPLIHIQGSQTTIVY